MTPWLLMCHWNFPIVRKVIITPRPVNNVVTNLGLLFLVIISLSLSFLAVPTFTLCWVPKILLKHLISALIINDFTQNDDEEPLCGCVGVAGAVWRSVWYGYWWRDNQGVHAVDTYAVRQSRF